MTPHPRLRLESLESRRAPATLSADHKTITFTDPDGDTASVAFSAPVLTDANAANVLHFAGGFLSGNNAAPQQLETIDLTGLPGGLSVTVKATTVVGDGKVDVGWVNGTGKDVGTINISGDLGRIIAGDANTKTPGLRALVVGSLGVRDPAATQEPGGDLISVVNGAIGSLAVARTVRWASVSATGGADGRIGAVKIGGDLTADPATASTGLIQATGAIGPVSIGGNVVGSDQPTSGLLAGGTLGPVTILGNVQGGLGTDSAAIIGNLGIKRVTIGTKDAPKSVTGGAGAGSASIRTNGGSIGAVTISGTLSGGAGAGSAAIRSTAAGAVGGNVGPVVISGDVTGDAVGTDSASIQADGNIASVRLGSLTGRADGSGSIKAGGSVGPVTIAGDVTGGSGAYSGAVTTTGGIASLIISGSVYGGGGSFSGGIQVGKNNASPTGASLGPVRILGDLTGGTGVYSGAVQAYATLLGSGGRIAAVTIAGDVTGGAGKYSGAVYAQGHIGRVLIGTPTKNGSLTGGLGPFSAAIVSTASNPAAAGITAVTVYGDVTGGAGDFSAAINTNGKVGPVAVHANGVGNKGDVTGGGGRLSASVRGSTIAAVTIDGTVTGGHGINSASIIADRTIGTVTVNTDWVGASIAAGIDPGLDGYFGTGDDTKNFAGSIGAIAIKGTADGSADTVSSTDHFAFTSNWVKSLKIHGATKALNPGKGNDTTSKPLGTTGDFVVVELP